MKCRGLVRTFWLTEFPLNGSFKSRFYIFQYKQVLQCKHNDCRVQQKLSFSINHIWALCISAQFRIQYIHRFSSTLPHTVLISLSNALVSSRLDFSLISISKIYTSYIWFKLSYQRYNKKPKHQHSLHWLSLNKELILKSALQFTSYRILSNQSISALCSPHTKTLYSVNGCCESRCALDLNSVWLSSFLRRRSEVLEFVAQVGSFSLKYCKFANCGFIDIRPFSSLRRMSEEFLTWFVEHVVLPSLALLDANATPLLF